MHLLLLLCSLLLSARYTCGISATPSGTTSGTIASSPPVPAGEAGPPPSMQGVDKWTINDHRIACNPAQCMYSFDIFENLTDQPMNQQISTHCEFLVDAAGGPNSAAAPALPASRTPFQDKTCGGGSSNRSYTVNGGFTNTSSVVLCFTNSPEDKWAFFGFDPWEFLSGPPKVSPAYPIGVFGNNSDTGHLPDLNRGGSLLSRRDSHVWKFLSGTRVTQNDLDANKVDIKFSIQGPTGTNVSCWAVLDSPPEVLAEKWSFSHKGCRNSQWSFGWGYDDYQDTGVLSVFE
ncbi:hypothetical protein PG985_014507 [Apiospora marii]|uniref:Uncharacterized protein n=1 Tax=Apiospora marii TaxID=335849 RepID=A0ABR1R4Y3_9PEZI